MSSIRLQQNAILFAAAEKLVSYGSEAAQLLVNGKETKHLTKKGLALITLFQAYKKNVELETEEIDALLYCLRLLSGQSSFPTISPIVGQDLNSIIQILSNITFLDEGVSLGNASEVNFTGVAVVATKVGNRIDVLITGGAQGAVILIGDYDASTNLFPASPLGTGSSGNIAKGNMWDISVAGTLGGEGLSPGSSIMAKIDNPGQTLANWRIFF